MIFLSIRRPNKIQFWYSLLDEKIKSKWIFALHFMYNTQVSLMRFGILFLVVNSLSYTSILEALLESGTLKGNQRLKLLSYREAQVLSIYFGKSFATCVAHLLTMSPILCVVYTYGSIRYYETLDWKVYAHMPFTLFVTLLFT
ncbi:unnamed protein product, partial [Allacma fusca]